MTDFIAPDMAEADRLFAISQRMGFALWQLQELEDVLAQHLVIRTKAKRGMALAACDALIEKARSRPFGVTLREVANVGLFEPELQAHFDALLAERNWLVHRSRRESRASTKSDALALTLIARVDAIADQSLALLREVGDLTESFVMGHGVSKDYIDTQAAAILRTWHDPTAA